MRERNSSSSQILEKNFNSKIKLTNTDSFASFNSNFSTIEKDKNASTMNDVIKKIINYQTQNEGRTKDEEISYLIKKDLFKINKKIYNIVDERNYTFLHILTESSNYYPLKIICNTYYILLDDESLFFKWFFLENKDKLTALDIASVKGNKQILSYFYSILIKTNKSILKFDDKNNQKNTIFHYSAKCNQYYSILFWYEKLQKFFPKTKIFDTKNANNQTPLHLACFHNSYECVQLLIGLGADVNAIDKDGKSVLVNAINSNNIKIIELLIINGADCNKKDSEGKSPYEYSINVCDTKIQLLFKNKNKINLVNNNKNSFEIIQLLLIFFFFLSFFLSRFIDIENYYEALLNNTYIIIGLGCLGISLIFIIISLIMMSYFLCCIKHKQHIKKKKSNLLELYDKYNNDICVICLRRKKEKTFHCVTCNLCIEEWKFHSYWLNVCITKEYLTKYTIFFFSIILLLLSNVISEIFFLLFAFLDKSEYKRNNNLFNNIFYIYESDQRTMDENKNENIKNYIFIPCFITFILFFIILTILIIIKFFKRKKEKNIFKENQNYNNLKYGLIDEEGEENKKDDISSSVGASIGD